MSSNKVMTAIFWNAKRITFIDYLKRVKRDTGELYASFFVTFKGRGTEKNAFEQKNIFLPWQCSRTLVSQRNRKQLRIMVRIAWTYTLLDRFST